MPLMKTSNPALGENTFRGGSGGGYGYGTIDATARMTIGGTVNKTGILLICAFATAAWTWYRFMETRDIRQVAPLLTIGVIGGFCLGNLTPFKKERSPGTAPIYALLEGMVLGGSSAMVDMRYPGMALQPGARAFCAVRAVRV